MNKLAIIMRGVPGSGKSSFLSTFKDLVDKNLSINVHSTDDLYIVNGEYKFDFTRLGEMHSRNLREFEESLKKGVNIVICDNTNIKSSDFKNYVNVATEYDYPVIAVTFVPDELEKHAERNVHKVPIETISRMKTSLLANLKISNPNLKEQFYIFPKDGYKDSPKIASVIGNIIYRFLENDN